MNRRFIILLSALVLLFGALAVSHVAAACVPEGGACGGIGECCLGSCDKGICKPCLTEGYGCAADDVCCSDICNKSSWTCAAYCVPDGEPCPADPTECCSGSCAGANCALSCAADGESCDYNDDCCNEECIKDADGIGTCAVHHWYDFITAPFRAIKDVLGAIFHLITNLGLLAALLFTGIPQVLIITAGISYLLMLILGLVATGLFAVAKFTILGTLSVAVIPGHGVEVVDRGWAISRDIASMFFLGILAFIGLATIFRIKSYQFQKTIPVFIIMALLLNFSGVFVGVVVDMGNIATDVFIQPVPTYSILTGPIAGSIKTLWNAISHIPERLFQDNPIEFFTQTLIVPVADAVVKVIFYFALCLAFLLVPLLFIIRIGILWILTILSPLAFLAYVIPQTRSLWNQWWKQLIQWSFIGVPLAFFFYLSMIVANTSTGIDVTKVSGSWIGDLIATLIAPILLLLFIAVGFFVSFSFVPSFAQGIMTHGKDFVVGAARRGGAALGKKFGGGIEKRGAAWATAAADRKANATSRSLKFFHGLEERQAKVVGTLGGVVGGWSRRTEGSIVSKAREDLKNLSEEEILLRMKVDPRVHKTEALAAIHGRDRKKYQELEDSGKIKRKDTVDVGKSLWEQGDKEFAAYHSGDDMAKAIFSKEWEGYEDLKKKEEEIAARPASLNYSEQQRQAFELGEARDKAEQKKSGIMEPFAKVANDPLKLPPDALKNQAFAEAYVNVHSGDKIGRAAKEIKEAADIFQKIIDKKGSKILGDNASLSLWLTGGGAADAGLYLPEELKKKSRDQIKDSLREVRTNAEDTYKGRVDTLVKSFSQKEQMLFRAYNRPDNTAEMKKAIEGAIGKLDRRVPTTGEIDARIGSLEKIISQNAQLEQKTREELRQAQVANRPTKDFTDKLDKISRTIGDAEKKEEAALKRLWDAKKIT